MHPICFAEYSDNFSYLQYIPSVKYDAFIAERMGNKDVVALPGLVESSRKRLINDHGIEKVRRDMPVTVAKTHVLIVCWRLRE